MMDSNFRPTFLGSLFHEFEDLIATSKPVSSKGTEGPPALKPEFFQKNAILRRLLSSFVATGKTRLLHRVVVPLMLPLFLTACVLSGVGDEEPVQSLASSWIKPDDPQEKLGAREHPLVLAKYGGEYENPQAEALVAVILGKLVAVSDDPARVYKVTLLDSPKVNAFALPGGYLYLTRGLLALANDSSELAAVIAHEMAHVSANHAILRRDKIASNQIGQEVADLLGSSASTKIALAANQLKLAEFSREQELQADTVGIRMIGNAGYDPFSAARFLETMARYQALQNGSNGRISDISFLSSHPSTPRRIELARKHARFFGAPGIGTRDRERLLKGIDGLLFGDTADEGFVRGLTFSHTGLGITFAVPQGFRIENQPKSVLASGSSDVATRFDAAVLASRSSLAEYMESGWINGLVEGSVREEPLNGLKSAVARARTDGWQFHIRVFHIDDQVFRFITAAPMQSSALLTVSNAVAGTFRQLSKQEAESLQPLRVKVVRAGPNDSLSTLSRTNTLPNRLELFKVLNNLRPGQSVRAGEEYKTVSGG